MKPGQKLSVNGYQVLLFPMQVMNITQGNNGRFSHMGVNALDIAGKDTGIDPTYAPCDMHYVWNDSYANGNAIFFQSDNKVLFADGTIDYATFMFIHDNYIADILQVRKFKQGQEFGDEGTAGNATGNHCHFEVAKGKYVRPYDGPNGYGVYCLHNSISADKACVIDGTTIKNGNGMNWKKASQIPGNKPYKESDLIREDGIAKWTVDKVRIRKGNPLTGETVGYKNTGNKQQYKWKWVGPSNRYVVWEDGGTKYFCAVSGSATQGVDTWATFSEVPTPKPPKEPETPKGLIQEDGIAYFTNDTPIIVHKNSATGPDAGKRFNNGDKQRYTHKWVGNGHRYIVWKENKVWYFAAVSGSETQGTDPWATFGPVEDPKPSEPDKPVPPKEEPDKPTEPEKPSEPENPVNPDELPEGVIAENGIAVFKYDAIRIRKGGPEGQIVGYFNTGDRQRYYYKYVGKNNRYVVWKNDAGDYLFAAVSGSATQGVDVWADFLEPDDENLTPPSEGDPTKPIEPEQPDDPEKPEFSDNPDDENFLENPDLENEIFTPKSKLFEKYGVNLVVNIVQKSLFPYKCPFVIKKEGTSAHNAGTNGDPSALRLSESMAGTKEQKSWHFSVDETNIVQNLPLNRNCWSNGDFSTGYKSKNYVSYEMCRDMLDANNEVFETVERNGALLTAELMYQNGWTKETIKKHQDWDMLVNGKVTHKYCPHKTLDKGWDRYVNMVLDFLQEAYDLDKPVEPEKPEDDETKNKLNLLLDMLLGLFKSIGEFLSGFFNKKSKKK